MVHHRNAWKLFFLISLTVLSLLLFSNQAEAREWTVDDDGTGDFTSIQDAVNASSSGDLIQVLEGTYQETLLVEKTVTIRGQGNNSTILLAPMSQIEEFVNLSAPGVIFQGFRLDGLPGGDAATLVSAEDNIIVRNNNFAAYALADIILDQLNGATIENNSFEARTAVNIFMNQTSNNTITGNLFSANFVGSDYARTYYGLYARNSCDNVLEDNVFYSSTFDSLRLENHSNNNLLRNNRFLIHPDLTILECSGNTFQGNHFHSSSASSFNLASSTDTTLRDNELGMQGVHITGKDLSHWNSHDMDASNTISGRPLGYYSNQDGGETDPSAGQLILANCSDLLVENLVLNTSHIPLLMGFSDNNLVKNISFKGDDYGFYLQSSSNNSFLRLNGSADRGVYLRDSNDNQFSELTLKGCSKALQFVNSTGNLVENSWLENNDQGILLEGYSSHNSFINISLLNNRRGLELLEANHTTLRNLTVNDSYVFGLRLRASTHLVMSDTIFIQSRVELEGERKEHWTSHHIDESNLLEERPIYYRAGANNLTLPLNLSLAILADCRDIVASGTGEGNPSFLMGFSQDIYIQDFDISSPYYGLYFQNCSRATVTNVSVGGAREDAVALRGSDNITLQDCQLRYTQGEGINMVDSRDNRILRTDFDDSRIVMFRSKGTSFQECDLGRSSIYLTESENNSIRDSSFSRSAPILDRSHNNQLIGNTFKNPNNMLMSLERSSHNRISSNNFEEEFTKGISISEGTGNELEDNVFSEGDEYCIQMIDTTNLTLRRNSLELGGLHVEGDLLEHWNTHEITDSNTLGGKPIYYFVEEEDVYISGGAGQVFLIECHNASVKGLRITGAARGVVARNCSNITIDDNSLTDTVRAIYLHGVVDGRVKGNNFVGGGRGIDIENCRRIRVEDNHCRDEEWSAIYVSGLEDSILKGNSISGTDIGGFSIYRAHRSQFIDNRCSGARGRGMSVSDSDNNSFKGNSLRSNEGGGLSISNSHNNSILENSMTNNEGEGLYITNSHNNSCSENVISGNEIGVNWRGASSGSSFQGNDVFNNQEGLNYTGQEGTLDAKGNWWGSDSGPYHKENNTSGRGNNVSGDVDFSSWSKERNNPEDIEFSAVCYALGFLVLLIMGVLALVARSKRWEPTAQNTGKLEARSGGWNPPSDYWKNNCLHCGAELKAQGKRHPGPNCPNCGKTIEKK